MEKKSEFYNRTHKDLRIAILNEIVSLVRKHTEIEMAVEFVEDISYANGIDEQDSPQVIETVTEELAIIEHQGNEVERVRLEHLSTETLIAIIKGLEKSYEESKLWIK
jgi:hypothetical protein